MPKNIKERDCGRFRIIPTEEKQFFIQEKVKLFGTFVFWTTLERQTLFGETPFIFETVDKAKEFIDKKLFDENNPATQTDGAIYYP